MSLLRRLQVVIATIVSIGMVGILYAEVGTKLVNMGTGDGDSTGPFSDVISQVDTVWQLVLVLILLGIVVWFIVGSVKEEQTVRRRPRQ